MLTRMLEVNLSDDAARLYDAAVTGNDDDVILAVEKAIIARLYPDRQIPRQHLDYVDTDPELVAVSPLD